MKNLTYSGFLRSEEKFYSTGEEWANAITHALATVAARRTGVPDDLCY